MVKPKQSITFMLLDGRTEVNVFTKSGAHALIQDTSPQKPTFDFFTTHIPIVNRIRKKATQRKGSRKVTAHEKEQLSIVYFTADALARSSDHAVFATIPDSEIECWINHIMEHLVHKTQDRRWTETGTLSWDRCADDILAPCAAMFSHATPARFAYEKGFFPVLGDFVSSCQLWLPCDAISELIVFLVSNAVFTVALHPDKFTFTIEKAFKKMEACGMLVHYIRCSTIPTLSGNVGVLQFYDELLKCPALLQKKFKSGTPCGDLLHHILNNNENKHTNSNEKKKDNTTKIYNTELGKKFKSLSSFAEIMQPRFDSTNNESVIRESIGGLQTCRYCNKSGHSIDFQLSLKACSRCKNAYYCCKECQTADWKSHKHVCRLVTKAEKANCDGNGQTLTNFSESNYFAIMKRYIEVCDDKKVDKSELLLEVDFIPNADYHGMAPALATPPHFTVAKARDYFEGSRPNQPNWWGKKTYTEDQIIQYRYDEDEETMHNVMQHVKDQYDRMTSNHILCLCRFPSNIFSARLQIANPTTLKEIFSDDAMAAVRTALKDRNYAPLRGIFRKEDDHDE